MEDTPVKDAVFDKEKGLWTVLIDNSSTTYTVSSGHIPDSSRDSLE